MTPGAMDSPGSVVHGPLTGLAALIDAPSTVIVTDRVILERYGADFPDCPVVLIPSGEEAKSLATLESVYARFLDLGLDRKATVLAIGGGSVSDLAGFAAATWMRGVRLVVVPTTLLSMVDASMGGKNAVDFRGRKNLVGTFLQPELIYCDVSLASSLPGTEFRSGVAEMAKHGLLDGERHFSALEAFAASRAGDIVGGDLAGIASGEGRDALGSLVEASQRVKMGIVLADAKESGARRLLNLGHTLGHAVEASTGLPHGFAVAAGLGFACRLSVSMGAMRHEEAARVTSLLAAWGLPTTIEAAVESGTAMGRCRKDPPLVRRESAEFLRDDKKKNSGDILFALPRGIGSVEMRAIGLETLASFILEDR